MILGDVSRALAQLADPRFLRAFLLGLAGTVALLALFSGVALWGVGRLSPETLTLPIFGEIAWIDDLLQWASAFALLALSVLLMVPVATAVTAFFLDDVVDAVEARHYPQLPAPRRRSVLEGIGEALGQLALLGVANVLLLVPYLLFPPAIPFLFYGVNGLLLAREYFALVALRRLPRTEAKALRRANSLTIWLAGVLMALALTVPLLNLCVPILGAATFCHLFHRLDQAEPTGARARRR